MTRLLAVLLLLCTLVACRDDRVTLRRGPIGPAEYDVRTKVGGSSALGREALDAVLRVTDSDYGATLRLEVGDGPAIVAELVRDSTGKLALDTVQGVSPRSAGEADLASIVQQLDPPLAPRPVRLRERWSSTRRIDTETITARLTSRLRISRFVRSGGHDAAELVGIVSGTLNTTGPSGTFAGRVSGRTTIAWQLEPGRVGSSHTSLTWTIRDVGRVVLQTSVTPA
ncbi:MAG TPA: hypothetical protein VNE62_07925 [Actinomycetota bacterium]|nr:hypothetical protein [Actinomycetota bacterium]